MIIASIRIIIPSMELNIEIIPGIKIFKFFQKFLLNILYLNITIIMSNIIVN